MNNFIEFSKKWFQSNDAKSSFSKVKSTIIAILLGLIAASIVLGFLGHNPFSVFSSIFDSAFSRANISQSTWATISLFILSGVANAIAFKTGLFNIGVSGQMFFTGVLTIIIGFKMFGGMGFAGILMLLVIGMIIGGLVAALAGALKAIFNVHEVVSTILLNWTFFFIGKWILNQISDIIENGAATKIVGLATGMHDGNSFGTFAIIISIFVAIIFALIFAYTTLGYNLKVTGLSPSASKAGGIMIKRNIILSMLLSGLVAGILGVISFVVKERQVPTNYFTGTALPDIGFSGIAVALLAFNNPIGVIPIAFIFGVLESGSTFGLTSMGIDSTMANLINGLIIYFSAISIVFQRFRIINMIYVYYRLMKSEKAKEIRIQHKGRITNIKSQFAEEVAKLEGLSDAEKSETLVKLKVDKKILIAKARAEYKSKKAVEVEKINLDYKFMTSKHYELSKPEKKEKHDKLISKYGVEEERLNKELAKEQAKISSKLTTDQKQKINKTISEINEKIENNKNELELKIKNIVGGE